MPDTNLSLTPVVPAERRLSGAGHQPFRVEDVKLDNKDARGIQITQIYALRSGRYAVYQAGDVCIQFADDPDTEIKQRKRVLELGDVRADLAALLIGWPRDRRKVYDCKTAMALQLMLDDDGDVVGARKVIEGARADAYNERSVAGRLQYLASVVLSCLLLGALSWALSFLIPAAQPGSDASSAARDIWMAGQAGLLGAAFSVVLAIKSRTVALDTDLRGNASDGFLRLAIGLISGGFLLLLLSSGMMPTFTFGDTPVPMNELRWEGVVVLGFLAGFIERMVPDLLNKAQQQSVGAPAPSPA